MMMPGLIVLTRGPPLAPPDRFGLHPKDVGPLGDLVGVQAVAELIRLQHRQAQQLLDGRGRQGFVLARV
jgi:hypothetical protein